VNDLKMLIVQYDRHLTQNSFIDDLEILLNNFKLFSKSGDIRQVIERAEVVMLDSISKELIEESPFDEDINCHC